VLPSISCYAGQTLDFYDALKDELLRSGDVVLLEYEGAAGMGTFTLDGARDSLRDVLATQRREGRKVGIFGCCTGFLVAVLALRTTGSAVDSLDSVDSLFGWHVPKLMDFAEWRVGKFRKKYGIRIGDASLGTHAVNDALSQLQCERPTLRVRIARGLECLEDEPEVHYLEVPDNGDIDRFSCSTHIPTRDCDGLAEIIECARGFLVAGDDREAETVREPELLTGETPVNLGANPGEGRREEQGDGSA